MFFVLKACEPKHALKYNVYSSFLKRASPIRRSKVAGHGSQITGYEYNHYFVLSPWEAQNMFIVQRPFLSYTTFQQ